MAAEDAGRRAGRVEQDRVDRRRRRPGQHVGRDDLGGEPGAREIVAQVARAGFRETSTAVDPPAGGGELHRLAARRGAKIERGPARARRRAAAPGCEAATSCTHHAAFADSRAGRRRRCRRARRRWPGIRLIAVQPRRGGVGREARSSGGGAAISRAAAATAAVAPGLAPALARPPAGRRRHLGQAPHRAASACRTRRGPAAAARRRRAAARSRWRHGAACPAPAPGRARCAARSAPWRRRASACRSPIDQRVEIGQPAQRLGGDGVGEGAVVGALEVARGGIERAFERQPLAQHRVEQAQRAARRAGRAGQGRPGLSGGALELTNGVILLPCLSGPKWAAAPPCSIGGPWAVARPT